METEPVFASYVLDQLRSRNNSELAFSGIIADYQVLLKRNRELQVRNGQLDKEANELRMENSMLSETANMTRMAAANAEEVTELRLECKKLQDQVNQLFEEKSKLAEKLLAESEQLRIVRDNFNQQDKTVTEQNKSIKEVKAQKKEMQAQIDLLKAAQVATAEEIKAGIKENEKATKQIQQLEKENQELTQRVLEVKSREAERMNEVNNMCNEMLQNAKNIERAAAAEAQFGGRQVLGKLFGSRQSRSSNDQPGTPGTPSEQLKDFPRRASLIETQVPEGRAKNMLVHDGGCYALAFNRSGSVMASAGADKVVRLWEPSSATQTSQLHGMQELVLDLGFVCDQNHILAAGGDKSLRLWNLSTGRVKHTLTGHSDKVSSVSCNPVDERLAVSGSMDRSIKTWDLHKGFVSGSLVHHSRCHSVRFTMDGGLLASGHMNGSICFWDKRTHKAVHEIAGLHTQQICSLAMGSRTGLVLSCGKDHVLKLVDPRSYQVRQTMRAPGFLVGNTWCSATISADELYVAGGSTDGQIFIWEVNTGNLTKTVGGGKSAAGVLASCWSPQGAPLVTSDRNGNVAFWE